ncbi:MAG TPA: hypothetical protein DIC48_06635 [Leuconostoc pseudomesenteroides]|nr:hypothetical protein [Leuconostoc pseudomesenteroides]
MSSLFTLIFIASIVWFFIARRKDKKSNGKITKNTWYILILTAVSFLLVGATAPKQNEELSTSEEKTSTKKQSSSSSELKKSNSSSNERTAKKTKISTSKKTSAKKASSSSSAKSSSAKNQSTAKPVKKANTQLTSLNEWYKNKYYDEQDAAYKKDGEEYFGTKEQIMQTALTGFKIENGDLIAVINNNRLKGENLTQKEVANYAFNVVYNDYSGDLPHYDNLSSDGSVKQDVMLHPERYSTLE